MKFKTWEKIYWAILGVLFVFSLVTGLLKEGDIPVTIQGEQKLVSKGTYAVYLILGYVIIFVPIWLLVRWIVNKGDKDKEEKK